MADEKQEKVAAPFAAVPPAGMPLTEEAKEMTKRYQSEEMVTMAFPTRVWLTLDTKHRVMFEPGLNQVPKSLSEHPYLLAHGVKVHQAGTPAPELSPAIREAMDWLRLIGHSDAAANEILMEKGYKFILEEKKDAEERAAKEKALKEQEETKKAKDAAAKDPAKDGGKDAKNGGKGDK